MLKNRFFAAMAMAGLVSFAACGGGEEEPAVVEEPVAEEPAAPVTPAPVITDTAVAPATTEPAAGTDTTAM